MMTAAFFSCFFILLVAILSQTKAERNGSSNESGCDWNCTIVDWNFGKETKTLITEKRIVKLDVKFRLLVNKHCVNQTEVNTSRKQLYWWIWLTANSEPSYSHGFVTETFSGTVRSIGSGNTGQTGMSQISCALKHPIKSASNRSQSLSLNNHIALLLVPEDDAESTGRLHSGILYNTEASINNVTKLENRTDSVTYWTNVVQEIMSYPLWIIFLFYSPVIICLFSAIEVKEQGVRVMILEGPSIMSLRGCLARYFWSSEDDTNLIRNRKGLSLFLLLLLIVSVIHFTLFYRYPQFSYLGKIQAFYLITNLLLTCYGLFIIRTVCVVGIATLSLTRPCLICQFLGVEHIRRGGFQEEVRQHLRIQPLIFMKFHIMFVRWFFYYANSFSVLTSPRVGYILLPIQVFLCILWLPTIPLVIITLSAVCLFFITVVIFCSCPLVTLYDRVLYRYAFAVSRSLSLIRRVIIFVQILILFPAVMVEVDLIATQCAFATILIVRKLVMNLNESLPYVAVSVLILYYLWSCYSSFTDKYQDLALKLYKHYNTTAVQLQSDKIMKIPKNLFDMACEELMPVRQSVCMLLVKIVLILMFVGTVFSIVMETTGVTPVTQAVVTFFSGSFPKLVAIFYGAGNKGNIEDAALDRKTRCVVQEYTTRSSSMNQDNQNENLDATNEENAPLIDPTERGYGTV